MYRSKGVYTGTIDLHVWGLVHRWAVLLTKKQSGNFLGTEAAKLILGNCNI